MENEKLLTKRFWITTLIFLVVFLTVLITTAKTVWNFCIELIMYDNPRVESFSEFSYTEKIGPIILMVVFIVVVLGLSYFLAKAIFCILFINNIEAYEQAQREESLNNKLAATVSLINQGFTGNRVIIIQQWEGINTNLDYNVNYFLQKFEDKITIVDQKIDKDKVMISFKLKS